MVMGTPIPPPQGEVARAQRGTEGVSTLRVLEGVLAWRRVGLFLSTISRDPFRHLHCSPAVQVCTTGATFP